MTEERGVNITRVGDRVTLGVLGLNKEFWSWSEGVKSEEESDLLHVRCVADG